MSSDIEALREELFYQQNLLEELNLEIEDLEENGYSFINCDGDVVEVSISDRPCIDAHIRCWHPQCGVLRQISALRAEQKSVNDKVQKLQKQLYTAVVKQAAEKAKETQKH